MGSKDPLKSAPVSTPLLRRSHLDFLIVLAGTTFATATGFILKIAIGRQLGADALGIFCICYGMLSTLAVVGDFGVRYAVITLATPLLGEKPQRASSMVGSALILKLIGGVSLMTLGWLLADWTAHSWFHKENLSPFLRITVSGVFLWSLWDGLEGCLQIKQRFTKAALLRIAMDLIRLVSYFGLCFYQNGRFLTMDRFMWLYFLSIGVSLLLGLPMLWRELQPRFDAWKEDAATLLRFSGWIFAYRLFVLLLLFLDSLCLSRWSGLTEVGHFEAAKGLAYAMLLVSETLGQVLLPKVSQLRTPESLAQFLSRFYRYLGALGLCAALWMLMAGNLLVLFGSRFQDPTVLQTFKILVIASMSLMPSTVMGTLLMSLHRTRALGLLALGQVILALGGYSVACRVGIVATASTTAGVQVLGAFLMLLYLRRVISQG